MRDDSLLVWIIVYGRFKILVSRVVIKADRVVHWHESHVKHRYVTVEGHLGCQSRRKCRRTVHVLSSTCVQCDWMDMTSVSSLACVTIVARRFLMYDRRFSVLEIRHRSSFPKLTYISMIGSVCFKHYNKNCFLQIHIISQQWDTIGHSDTVKVKLY